MQKNVRLSTFLLSSALSCVVVGWLITQWRERTSDKNESIIAYQLGRFQTYIEVYRTIDTNGMTPQATERRQMMLKNIVKATFELLELEIPDRPRFLPDNYKFKLQYLAFEALVLLEIDSPDEFREAIIADARSWERRNPDLKIYGRVLHPETKELKSEFVEYLKRIIEFGKPTSQ